MKPNTRTPRARIAASLVTFLLLPSLLATPSAAMAADVWKDYCESKGDIGTYPGHGDTITMWTPLMVINSPYAGSAQSASGTRISTSYSVGTQGTSVESDHAEEAAISASHGTSGAYYQLLTWERRHYCLGTMGSYHDYWFIRDSTPRGDDETVTTGDLTGGSPQTDNDNLDRAVFTDWRAEWQVASFKYVGATETETKCTDPGIPLTITVSNSELYNAEMMFTTPSGHHIGKTRATANSNSYTYTLDGGHCWKISYPSGQGKTATFDYLGPAGSPEVEAIEWVNPDPVGCDVLDIVEDYMGTEFDWSPYTVHMKSHGSDYGEVKATPQGSIPFGSVEWFDFDNAIITDGPSNELVRAWKGNENGGGSAISIDGTVTFNVDYEYDAGLAGTVFPLVATLGLRGLEDAEVAIQAIDEVNSQSPMGDEDVAQTNETVLFHAIPEGANLRVRVLSGTTLGRFKATNVLVTPDLLAAREGDLVAVIEDLVLDDPEDELESRLTCPSGAIEPHAGLDQVQSWVADARLSNSGTLVMARNDWTDVQVRLVV